MLVPVRVTDTMLVASLVAAARQQAALVDLDQAADALDHPLDPTVATRLALLVIDGRDQDVLRPHLVGDVLARRIFKWPDFQANGVGVEVGVVAVAGRL